MKHARTNRRAQASGPEPSWAQILARPPPPDAAKRRPLPARMPPRLVIINVSLLVIYLTASSTKPAHGLPVGLRHSREPFQAPNSEAADEAKLVNGSSASSAAAPTSAPSMDANALNYLQKYGYMSAQVNSGANNLISEDSFATAITSFQKFAGLPETGLADEQTLKYMEMPRCGNKDITVTTSGDLSAAAGRRQIRRRKRYALQGSKWRRQELTYRISQYPTRFNGERREVDAEIERAFGIWSQVAPIDFVVKPEGRVHIDIRFASGDHGDGDAFDGPGNTLAHAYFPQYGGDAHFDDQEYWTVDSHAGTNIFQVAAHELGHSLGLGHSSVREALMAPFYQKYKPNFRLHPDDVLAIQALYGEKPLSSWGRGGDEPRASAGSGTTSTTAGTTTGASSSTGSTTAEPPALESGGGGGGPLWPGRRDAGETSDDEGAWRAPGKTPDERPSAAAEPGASSPRHSPGAPDLCSDPAIQAATRTADGAYYVFKGDHYWQLTADGLAPGYPRPIGADWEGLAGNLDAALTWADGKTFFFKGNKYWRFRNKRRDIGYPKLISAGFAGIPDDLDAAIVWPGDGRTYMFKGAQYWRFDSKSEPPVAPDYPRSIKLWAGVPSYLDAALTWTNNQTYFFKGPRYYRFDDREFRVDTRGRPPFPRSISEWWFGCGTSNLAQRAAGLSQQGSPAADGETALRAASGQPVGRDELDWSPFASREPGIAGTHINDRRPEAPKPKLYSRDLHLSSHLFGHERSGSAASAGHLPSDHLILAHLLPFFCYMFVRQTSHM